MITGGGANEVYASGLLTDYLEQQGFTVTRGLATTHSL